MTRTTLAGLAALAIVFAFAFALGAYQTDIYRKMLVWVTLALSFNFLFGIAGQLALSHFAFASLGAYALVILAHKLGLPFALAFVLALSICIAVALIVAIPATRLEGFYLALATLAFAQLVRVLIDEGGALTGGTGGITNYRLPALFGFEFRGPWYTCLLVLMVALNLWLLRRIDHSWFGRACRATRDNPRAAEAMGVDTRRVRIAAFVLTSALAGLAGMGYAYIDNVINPPVFNLENAFLLLFMIVIGGAGDHFGALLGAAVLYLAPFVLEPFVGAGVMLVFGVLMIVAILFRPDGLVSLLKFPRWRRVA